MKSSTITVAQSNAFVATFDVSPTGTGELDRLCRLPQVSLTVADDGGVPAGLSLLARHSHDIFLLEVAKSLD